MALLSNLFGSDSENSSDSDFLGILDLGGSANFSNESYRQEVDEDGSSETSYDNTSFGADLDLGSIISSMTDTMSASDSGGLFG